MKKLLVAFDSTHAAMAAQKALADLRPAVISTPRGISASCGMALLVRGQDPDALWERLSGCNIDETLWTLYEEINPGEYKPVLA